MADFSFLSYSQTRYLFHSRGGQSFESKRMYGALYAIQVISIYRNVAYAALHFTSTTADKIGELFRKYSNTAKHLFPVEMSE